MHRILYPLPPHKYCHRLISLRISKTTARHDRVIIPIPRSGTLHYTINPNLGLIHTLRQRPIMPRINSRSLVLNDRIGIIIEIAFLLRWSICNRIFWERWEMTIREAEIPLRERNESIFLLSIVIVAAQLQDESIGEVGDVVISRGCDFGLLAVVASEVFDFSD